MVFVVAEELKARDPDVNADVEVPDPFTVGVPESRPLMVLSSWAVSTTCWAGAPPVMVPETSVIVRIAAVVLGLNADCAAFDASRS